MIQELYFLNSRELSENLHQEEITEDLAFKHLLVYSILFASYIAIPVIVTCSQSDSFSIWYQILNFLSFAAIQYWGMNLLYQTNKQGDGKSFFLRWAALSLPVGIQVWAIGLILGVVYGGVIGFSAMGWASELPRSTWLITSIIFALIMQFIYFKLMQQNLTSCSSGQQQAASA